MFPSYLEVEKTVPSYFKPEKHCRCYLKREKIMQYKTNWIPAIWRLNNVVHNCQEQGKRL